jgi:hypothetical protein
MIGLLPDLPAFTSSDRRNDRNSSVSPRGTPVIRRRCLPDAAPLRPGRAARPARRPVGGRHRPGHGWRTGRPLRESVPLGAAFPRGARGATRGRLVRLAARYGTTTLETAGLVCSAAPWHALRSAPSFSRAGTRRARAPRGRRTRRDEGPRGGVRRRRRVVRVVVASGGPHVAQSDPVGKPLHGPEIRPIHRLPATKRSCRARRCRLSHRTGSVSAATPRSAPAIA